MIAQVGAVLATYWRRAVSGPIAIGAAAFLAVAVVGAFGSIFADALQTVMPACVAFLGTSLVALHFKQQVIQIQQRRIPHGAIAHVLVAMGFLALFALAPSAANMAIGEGNWGALGLNLALSAATFAYFTLQAARLMLLIAPLVLMACLSPVQKWLEELCEGRHEAVGLMLLAAGVCGIVATLAWLLQLSEEDVGYFDLSDPNNWTRCAPSNCQAQRRADWLWKLWTPSELQVHLWPQWAQGSLRQRIRLWIAGSNDACPVWLSTVFYLVLFWGMYVMLPGQRTLTMIFNALFMTFDPVYTVTSTISQRRQMAAIELPRPVERSRYFIEMGLAYAYRVPRVWLQFSIAWCLPAYVFASGAPAWGHQMFNLLVLTAASQVFFFGLTVWVMRYAVPLITWTALCCAVYIGVIFGVTMLSTSVDWRNASLDVLLWFTPGIVGAGALITWDAYRRWMQTEMG